MQAQSRKSYLFVFIQFTALLLIALSGPWLASNGVLLLLELMAIALGLWAIVTMRRVNIVPDVCADAQLIRSGPYRWLRHPMYTALLLWAATLLLSHFTLPRLLLWLILLGDLLIKLQYEEGLLAAHFPAYASYQRATKRLFPFVY